MIVASFSGGKDSTAMVLRMIELKEPLDKVIFCDTGLEFPAMYKHIEKVKAYVEANGIEFVTLHGRYTFEYMLLDYPINCRKKEPHEGFGFPNAHLRWCTKEFKTTVTNRYFKTLEEPVIMCVGLAADETKRLERASNQKDRHPLVEWGWTEADALKYCYDKGYDWYDESVGKGLYEIFDRTSCWLCPLSNLDYFRKLRYYYPDMWYQIGDMERRCKAKMESQGIVTHFWKFKGLYLSWQEMDKRFSKEDEAAKHQTKLEVD